MANDNFFKPDYTSPAAFYFSVKFSGFPDMDSSFQQVSGLKVTLGKEGDENDYVLHLPTPPKSENLVLKRCLLNNSFLDSWCMDALEDFRIYPKDIKLQLIDANGGSLASWSIYKAFPISWLVTLNSTSDQPAIETLTLNYRNFN